MCFEKKPYELSSDLNCLFKRSKVRLKILFVVNDYPGITNKDVILFANIKDKKRKEILLDLINEGILIAEKSGNSFRLWINEDNKKVVELINFMRDNDYFFSA